MMEGQPFFKTDKATNKNEIICNSERKVSDRANEIDPSVASCCLLTLSVAFLLIIFFFFFFFRMNGPLKEREETSRALVSVSLVSPMHKISDFLFVFFWLTMDVGPGDRLAPTGQLPLYLPHSILPPPCGSLSLDIFFEIVGKTAMKDQTRPHFYYSFRVRRLVLIDLTRHLTHFFSLLKF